MATVYKFEITSHWINYHPADMKKMIEKALYSCENEITVNNLEAESERPKTSDESGVCDLCGKEPIQAYDVFLKLDICKRCRVKDSQT